MINFFYENVEAFKIPKRSLRNWIDFVINEEGKKSGDINIIFCCDDYLLDINRRYLDHDYFTDVITFDYVEGVIVSGDIFISVDRLKENASIFEVSFDNELKRVIVHGILHLLGYNDESDSEKRLMTSKENYYLSKT